MILASWALFVLAQTPVETAQKKMRATEAYKAKKFETACQLFEEVVTEQKYDAWGWNDLCVCSIHVNDLSTALDALEKASALESAIGGDEPLKNAIAANEALLVSTVSRRDPVSFGPLAIRLAMRRQTSDPKGACALYDFATRGGAPREPMDWNFVANCRIEGNAPAAQVVEAIEHLDPEKLFYPAYELSGREGAARDAKASSDWRTSCAPLPNTCGAKLLACSKKSSSNENYTESSSESLVFIEATARQKWKTSPRPRGSETPILKSDSSSSPVRCPAGDGMTALDAVESGHVLLSVDPCARTATFLTFDRQCSHGSAQLVTEPIVITSP